MQAQKNTGGVMTAGGYKAFDLQNYKSRKQLADQNISDLLFVLIAEDCAIGLQNAKKMLINGGPFSKNIEQNLIPAQQINAEVA